jgi:multiple sugar transport system substrate-binding protein
MKRLEFRCLLVFILVLAFFLTGALPALAQAKGKLVIAGRDGGYGKALELAVRLFKEANPDVEMEQLKLPYGSLYEKLVISFRERAAAYDLVMLDDTWATEYMANGWLIDLEAAGFRADEDFISTALSVGRYPYRTGKLYALPIVGNVELFAYRKDLFDKYDLGQPKSWLDVLEAAVMINASEKDVAGVVFRGTKGNPIVTGFLPILWGFGSKVVDEKGRSGLNSPNALAALTFFLKLKRYAPKGVEVYNASEVRDALQKGDVAIAIEVWPAWVPSLDDPNVSKVVGKVEIQAAPGLISGPSPMLGAWLMGIAKDSKNKDAALEFLKFLTSPKIQKQIALDVGIPPTRTSPYTDRSVVEKYRWYPSQLKALEEAHPRPRITKWSEVEAILGDYLQLALTESLSPEKALREASERINAVLSR